MIKTYLFALLLTTNSDIQCRIIVIKRLMCFKTYFVKMIYHITKLHWNNSLGHIQEEEL